MAVSRWVRVTFLPAFLLPFLFLSLSAPSGAAEVGRAPKAPVQDAAPGQEKAAVSSIDLAPLDFRRLSPLRSRDGAWHFSINFFEEDRALVSFESAGIMRRLPGCPKTHDDRIVHALVVDVKTGEVLHKAKWYLHDRRQYLWPLASGRMLLRRGESLFELDRDLNEKPMLEVAGVFSVDVTPDGQQIIIGSAARGGTKEAEPSQPPRYQVRLLDASTLSVQETIPLERPVPPKMTSKGYADVVLKNGWTWLVRFGSEEKRRLPITRVRSSCIPDVEVSGENSLLIGRCTTAQDRYVISSFTAAGQFLWRQRWSEQLNTPVISHSISGARFALSSVVVVKQTDAGAKDSDEERTPEGRLSRIEVFNSATGTPVLKLETQPAIAVGGNVALSPEGTMLAVLRDAHLEFYQLGSLNKDEAAKLVAVRAGTPGLIPPSAGGDAEDDGDLADDDGLSTKQLTAFAAMSPPDGLNVGDTSNSKTIASNPPVFQSASLGDKPEVIIHSRAEAVSVDVLVTDSKGHPVSGLKAEDFSVSEDGTQQKVNYFKEHSVIDTQLTPPPDYKRPPNIFSNVSTTSQPDSATLILFDMLNTAPQDQSRARDALTKYIKSKPRNESFALCVLDGPLRLVRGFTADENALLLAMNDRRAKPSASLISQLDTSSLKFIRSATAQLDTPGDLTRSFAIAMAGLERSIQDEQLSQNDMRTYMTVGAFEELARYMAGVPGRKKILWLSAAFPLGQFASAQGLDAGPFHSQRNFVRLISKTMNLLASAHVSVYPVDIRGVMTNSISDVGEERPFTQDLPNTPLTGPSGMSQQVQAGGAGIDASASAAARNLANDHTVSPDGFVGRAVEDSAQRNSEHSAMDLVAEQTGGKAFYGSNDITQAVRTVVEQGTDYYTVSYSPANRRYDGRFRKIRVRVAGHGYRVAHRSGYFAEDPNRPPEKSEAVLQALSVAGMMHGAPESRQIPFQARIVPMGEPKMVNTADVGIRREGKASPSTIRLQHYSVDYAIPASSLRFSPGVEGAFHGSFRLLANSYDPDGRGLTQSASTAEANLKPENYRAALSDGFRLRQELDVPADASFLRLGVTDLSSSYIGTLEIPLPVAVPKDSPIARREGANPPVEPD